MSFLCQTWFRLGASFMLRRFHLPTHQNIWKHQSECFYTGLLCCSSLLQCFTDCLETSLKEWAVQSNDLESLKKSSQEMPRFKFWMRDFLCMWANSTTPQSTPVTTNSVYFPSLMYASSCHQVTSVRSYCTCKNMHFCIVLVHDIHVKLFSVFGAGFKTCLSWPLCSVCHLVLLTQFLRNSSTVVQPTVKHSFQGPYFSHHCSVLKTPALWLYCFVYMLISWLTDVPPPTPPLHSDQFISSPHQKSL